MSNTFKKSIHLIIALVCSITLFLAGAFIVPKPVAAKAEIPSEFQKVSFALSNIADGTYSFQNGVPYVAQGEFAEDFDQKCFIGTVNFNGNAKLYIAGSEAGKGLSLSRHTNGTALSAYWGSKSITNFTPKNVGVTTLQGTDVNFAVTFSVSDLDSDGQKDDITFGFYFDGVLYRNMTYTVNDAVDTFGSTVSIECFTGGSIKVKNDNSALAVPDKTLNQLSTQHFYIEDGTYGYSNGTVAKYGSYFLGTENSHFSANVKFSAIEGAAIHYAGLKKDNGLGGLVFKLENGDLVLSETVSGNNSKWTFKADEAGLTSFVDTTFKLSVSLKTVNMDDGNKDNDIELAVWFNDVLYKNEYIYLLDQLNNIGDTLGIYSPVEDSTVEVGVVSGLEITLPNKDIKKISIDSFNLNDNTYSHSLGDIAGRGEYKKGIANTYFSANVKYNGSSSGYPSIIYGNVNGAQWTGTLRAEVTSKTNFRIVNNDASNILAVIPASKTCLVNFEDAFRLGISVEVIDNDNDGEKDDVKIGVYFNEDLWDGGFIYQNDYAQHVGTGVSFWTPKGSSLELGMVKALKAPIESRPVDETLTKITLETVGIDDGTYGFNKGNFSKKSNYKKTWDNTIFSTAVTFSDTPTSEFMYAMTGDGWSGLRFQAQSETTMRLWIPNLSNKMVYFYADQAGVDSFLGEQFNLSISTRYVDSDNDGATDDVELGVWFNDILYKDEYVYLVNYAENMKNQPNVNLFSDKEGSTITLKSRIDYIPPIIYEKFPEGLTKITLNDFTIKDCTATYRGNDLYLNSAYDKSLENTYCEFYVTPSSTEKEMSIRYAGGGWGGLAIRFSDQIISAYDASGLSSRYNLLAKNSKMTSFTNQTYLLGVSTQYMDLDNDGEKDDVRFGIWANGTLCGNEYVDIPNYVQHMGKRFAVYIAEDGATLGLKSIMIPIDFELFGFTSNWATELEIHAGGTSTDSSNTNTNAGDTKPQSPQTGDALVRPMIFSCVALGGLLDTDKTHRRKYNVR